MKAAVYFGSIHIYKDMIPAYKSLLINSDVDKIYLLTEDDRFPYELHKDVEVINIAKKVETWFKPDGPNWNTEWKYVGLIRCALSKVFPNLDKILSIDCDTIVGKNVSELWDIPIDNYYYAGVREPMLSGREGNLYINAGVTMCNLKKLREDGKDDEMIEALNTKRFYFVCQDVMNLCCKDKILQIPSMYNVCDYTEHSNEVKIVHYAGIRGKWRDYLLVQQYRDIPISEIRKN